MDAAEILIVDDHTDIRETLAEVLQNPNLADIALAVISGADMDVVRRESIDVVAWFRKPIDLPALLSTLRRTGGDALAPIRSTPSQAGS